MGFDEPGKLELNAVCMVVADSTVNGNLRPVHRARSVIIALLSALELSLEISTSRERLKYRLPIRSLLLSPPYQQLLQIFLPAILFTISSWAFNNY
jgi:hypothetical protein